MKQKPWNDLMTFRQRLLGWIYLPIHVIALPLLMGLIYYALTGREPDSLKMNIVYYGVGLAVMVLGMWTYLKESYRRVTENILGFFRGVFGAFVLNFALSLLYRAVTELVGQPPSPNQDLVEDLTIGNMNQMFAMAVLMVPIVEECLFRGVIFGSIRRKHRILAYVVCVAAFSLYHVWQYAVAAQDWTLLLGAVQYIPISVALTYAYDRSGTIWAPIFLHMFNNALSLSLLGA